ncbi:MAG: NAD(P)/FAD-dependent oxidoreductase [Aureliella sp.]
MTHYDVAIIGSGFSASILAAALGRAGRRVIMFDRKLHPRFAIGESSTPLADLLLERMAGEFGLPELRSLSRWGIWKRELPQVRCGKKRGFSYFQHQRGCGFEDSIRHDRSLLVAASVNDEVSDTHWLRSDTDAWLFQLACEHGVDFCKVDGIEDVKEQDHGWECKIRVGDSSRIFEMDFMVDASGSAAVLPTMLRLNPITDQMRTNNRVVYGHFDRVQPMSSILAGQPYLKTNQDPFDCDDAAQHHLIDEGWFWMLRFDHGITSVGAVLDRDMDCSCRGLTAEKTWERLLEDYPTLSALMSNANLVAPLGGQGAQLAEIDRVSRCYPKAGGKSWFLLPSTAGIVDPLHSTGIAHALIGVQRIAKMLLGEGRSCSASEISAGTSYSRSTVAEVLWIDRIVACAYQAKRLSFDWFYAACCLYFLPAIETERLLHEENQIRDGFLCECDAFYQELVMWFETKTIELKSSKTDADIEAAVEEFRKRIETRNVAGLLEPGTNNRIARSVAPKS